MFGKALRKDTRADFCHFVRMRVDWSGIHYLKKKHFFLLPDEDPSRLIFQQSKRFWILEHFSYLKREKRWTIMRVVIISL